LRLVAAVSILALAASAQAQPAAKKPAPTKPLADILAASPKSAWRALDQANLVYLDLPKGRVIIELAPAFAPNHVANVKLLAKAGFYDKGGIIRAQDNFVVQWGIPDGQPDPPLGGAKEKLAPEFTRASQGLAFTALPDRDSYAAQTGFVGGFPAARDPKTGRAWLTHCYGTVAVARSAEPNSGNGGSLYAVIGPARHLDRNLSVVGRVVQGMALLSTTSRGEGAMGFYAKPADATPIKVRIGSDVPAADQVGLEALRTDSPTFATVAEARRNRRDDFYRTPQGGVDVCNVPLPVRPKS
jgi:peptidylprolyl isomerase